MGYLYTNHLFILLTLLDTNIFDSMLLENILPIFNDFTYLGISLLLITILLSGRGGKILDVITKVVSTVGGGIAIANQLNPPASGNNNNNNNNAPNNAPNTTPPGNPNSNPNVGAEGAGAGGGSGTGTNPGGSSSSGGAGGSGSAGVSGGGNTGSSGVSSS